MLRNRLALAIATAALAVASIGVPVAAAGGSGTTRVVDDDGRASVGSCDASTPASNTIQKGVNASSAGDTVLVCPGDYTEQVTIGPSKDGLVLRSRTSFAASIRRPRVLTGTGALVYVAEGADRVTVLGFRILFRSGTDCEERGIAALIAGSNAIFRANRIFTTGARTFDPCGYAFGIIVSRVRENGARASAGIAYNTVKDFQVVGVWASDTARTYLSRNSIRFTHARSECGGGGGATAGRYRSRLRILDRAGSAARRYGARSPAAGGAPVCFSAGMLVDGPADATILDNNVYSGTSSFSPSQRTPVMLLGIAIGTETAGSGTIVSSGNFVARVVFGHVLDGSRGARLSGNGATMAIAGFSLTRTTTTRLEYNEAWANLNGIVVDEDSRGNDLRDNDARGNADDDCVDESTGNRTAGTANTWVRNLGHDSDPPRICRPPAS